MSRFSSRRARVSVEVLEDRSVPAVLTVSSAGDANVRNDGLTLREAIMVVNRDISRSSLTESEAGRVTGTLGESDTIVFDQVAMDTSVISIAINFPIITAPVKIISGTDAVRGGGITLDGQKDLDPPGSAIDGLTFADTAGGSRVTGIEVQNFSGNGIVLKCSDAIVEGCYVHDNTLNGVVVKGSHNRIGGFSTLTAQGDPENVEGTQGATNFEITTSMPAYRAANAITANGKFGVLITATDDFILPPGRPDPKHTTYNMVLNNLIASNSEGGIRQVRSDNSDISYNTIVSNKGAGVSFYASDEGKVVGNLIGIQPAGMWGETPKLSFARPSA